MHKIRGSLDFILWVANAANLSEEPARKVLAGAAYTECSFESVRVSGISRIKA